LIFGSNTFLASLQKVQVIPVKLLKPLQVIEREFIPVEGKTAMCKTCPLGEDLEAQRGIRCACTTM
jgi:hypothetical protein